MAIGIRESKPGGGRSIEYTQAEVLDQFRDAMREYDITPPDEIIADGRKHDFCTGSSKKKKGIYKLVMDERPAGYFKDYKLDLYVTWRFEGDFTPFTPEQRQAYAEECRKREEASKAEILAEQNRVAKKAVWIWSQYKPASADHPYLVRKQIEAHGVKQGRNNTLVVPIFNEKYEIVNLQFIGEDGTKRFLKNGRKQGCFCWLGGKDAKKILICEGFATGASLREDTGYLVILTFDAGNMLEVAKTIRNLKPDQEIIICGDHDTPSEEMIAQGRSHDVGQRKAEAAAKAINCEFTYPAVPGQDFNDMLIQCGEPKGGIFDEYFRRWVVDNPMPVEDADSESSVTMR